MNPSKKYKVEFLQQIQPVKNNNSKPHKKIFFFFKNFPKLCEVILIQLETLGRVVSVWCCVGQVTVSYSLTEKYQKL